MDLRHLELEQALQKALVRSADEDLRAVCGAANLEHEGLDVLADAVVLEGRLFGGREDRLHALADIEDDRAWLDAVHGAGHEVAFTAGELVEDLVALDLADALEHDLLGGLGTDPSEYVTIELLDLDEIADARIRVVHIRLLHGHLGEFVLHLDDDAARAEDADLACLGIDPNVDVLVTGDPPVRRLDPVLDGSDQLLFRDLLLGVELEEGTDEVSTHDGLRSLCRLFIAPLNKETWGSPTSGSGRSVGGSIHPGAWTQPGAADSGGGKRCPT